MEKSEIDNKLFVSSVEKAFIIIEAFSCGQKYLSQTELTELTGMNKSAVQRFTHSLEAVGYLIKDTKTKCYALTPKVMDLSFNYLRTTSLIEMVTPRLVDIRNTFGVTLNVSVLDGIDIVYILRVPSQRQIYTKTIVGRRVPAYCSAAGRAMLSQLPEQKYTEIIQASDLQKRTAYTLAKQDVIINRIKIAKKNGFDINNQENIIGEIVIAAPIVNTMGNPIAAVHIPVSTREWTEEKVIKDLSNELLNLTQSIYPQ